MNRRKKLVDPWDTSIDDVVLRLKQELDAIQPPYRFGAPVNRWVMTAFPKIAEEYPPFKCRVYARESELDYRTWTTVHHVYLSGTTLDQSAELFVSFEPLLTAATHTHIQYITIFTRPFTGSPTVLSVRRKLQDRRDVSELTLRYKFPQFKYLYGGLRAVANTSDAMLENYDAFLGKIFRKK